MTFPLAPPSGQTFTTALLDCGSLLAVTGKEDLDLGPNDLHLDDFLLSGKFDLIAYADPELNLEDKKDMFNEELDLGEPVEEKEGGERRDRVGGPTRKVDNHSHPIGQVKQEVEDGVKTEAQHPSPQPGLVTSRRLPGAPGAPGAAAAGSSLPGSKVGQSLPPFFNY